MQRSRLAEPKVRSKLDESVRVYKFSTISDALSRIAATLHTNKEANMQKWNGDGMEQTELLDGIGISASAFTNLQQIRNKAKDNE